MYLLQDNFGNELIFDNQELGLQPIAGLGNPPIQYNETKGFLSDVTEVENYLLQPRDIQINIVKQLPIGTDYNDYWAERQYLLAFFTPFAAPLKLKKYLSDGTVYELRELYPQNGLNFTNVQETQNNFIIDEIVTLTAKNPVIFGNTNTLTPTESSVSHLVFPITFPIQFSQSGANFPSTITYTGTWKSYPIITLRGAYTTCTITYKDALIYLTNNIVNSEQRIIDLNPDNLSIVDQNGVNKFNELGIDSDLSNFYISPQDTNEEFVVNMLNSTGSSGVTITYPDVYLGI